MTMKLTKRDKVLLYILIAVVMAFAFLWLVIFPQLNKSADLDLALDGLKEQKITMDGALMSLEGMRSARDTAKQNYEEAADGFYPNTPNYEIDRQLTGLVVEKYGLTMKNLTMSGSPSGVAVPRYRAEAEAAEGSGGGTAETETEDISILTAAVSVSAVGRRSDCLALIDDLFVNNASVRVTGYFLSGEGEDCELTLNLDYYMKAPEQALNPETDSAEAGGAEPDTGSDAGTGAQQ